jgi:protein-S-isoprenylcysteine O-methyltransferase Ste14
VKKLNVNTNLTDEEREYPNSHLIQLFCLLSFLGIWFLDSFVFKLTTFLDLYIPLIVRLCLFLITLIHAIVLLRSVHHLLLDQDNERKPQSSNHHHPNRLITTGVMTIVRNPLYLSVLLLYFSFVLATFSLVSALALLIIFIIHDIMVNYEEQQLQFMFGENYLKYKNQVPKWFSFRLLFLLKRSKEN